jgi:hypothetical protein
MQDNETSVAPSLRRGPWNKGKPVGAKPPLRPKHVWSIRTKLQIADRRPQARPGDVQSGNRQQAARLRCRRPQGGRHCAARIRRRARNGAPEKDRRAGAVPNTPGGRSMTTSAPRTESPATFCSLRRADRAGAYRPANMHALSATGFALDPCMFGTHSLRRTKAAVPRLQLAVPIQGS